MHPPALVLVGRVMVTAVALLLPAEAGRAEPIKVYPANPHYFMRDGRPFVLVTSDHHYGAVIDADFDYARFLDFLAATGMNLTRIYPGGMFEPPNKFVVGNPLGPLAGRHILPWLRSTEVGAHATLAEPGKPSLKFDLDRWNPDYFARLKAFVHRARQKGLVVEVAFFNGMYADCWPLMPLYHANNTQGVGRYEPEECGLFTTCSPRNQDVLRYQRAYVATPGSYRDAFTLKAIPAARYRLEWVDPVSGAIKESKRLDWQGGDLRVTTPAYSLDVALRMHAAPAR